MEPDAISSMIPALGFALLALLLAAGIQDARTREIGNGKNVAIALLAPVWWWANDLGGGAIQMQLIAAGLVFVLFLIVYCMGQMGGGDVKLIGALALWVSPAALLPMLVAMSLLGGALTLLMLIDRWRRRTAALPETPYGVAIAIAGMLAVAN